jgi:hypothetical protein
MIVSRNALASRNETQSEELIGMRNVKTLGPAVLACFAFGAIAAAGAQANAPRWTVGANDSGGVHTLTAAETRGLTGETTGTVTITFAGGVLQSSSCTSTGTIIGSAAGSPGTSTGTLECTGVTVQEAAKCIVKTEGAANGTVLSTSLTGRLVWLEGPETAKDTKVGITFEPDPVAPASNAFEHIEVSGVGCAATNKFTVTGNMICEVSPITKHEVNGTMNCPSSVIKKYWNNETPRKEQEDKGLMVGVNAQTFVAHFINLHLTNNVTWGIEPG